MSQVFWWYFNWLVSGVYLCFTTGERYQAGSSYDNGAARVKVRADQQARGLAIRYRVESNSNCGMLEVDPSADVPRANPTRA